MKLEHHGIGVEVGAIVELHAFAQAQRPGATVFANLPRLSEAGTALGGPGLAETWKIGEDGVTWTLGLRKGVKFHDGTDFNADAVLFQFQRFADEKFEYYDPTVRTNYSSTVNLIASYKKVDDYTFEVVTKAKFAFMPYEFVRILIPSPTAVKPMGQQGLRPARDWHGAVQNRQIRRWPGDGALAQRAVLEHPGQVRASHPLPDAGAGNQAGSPPGRRDRFGLKSRRQIRTNCSRAAASTSSSSPTHTSSRTSSTRTRRLSTMSVCGRR